MEKHAFSRRHFLGTGALALPVATLAHSITETQQPFRHDEPGAVGRCYLGKQTRLTISMWDFSWLHGSHPGGAYEDLERRVVEARERGYNTLRVDCFPSRVLETESTFEKNWSTGDLPCWGQRAMTFSCNVRQKVATLANLCRKHGLWLGLDCWDKGHMLEGSTTALNGTGRKIAPVDEEKEFTRYASVWGKALKLMREDGVLERAVWIAPMNEVPHFAGRHLLSVSQLRSTPLSEGETEMAKNRREDEIYRRINHWMAEAIRAEVALEKIPISYSSLGAEDYANRLTDVYDVVDVHFMPGVIMDAADAKEFQAVGRGAPNGNFVQMKQYDLKAYSRVWGQACRRHYAAMLERTRTFHQRALQCLRLASGKRLQPIITESFGPCYWPDHPDVNWDWYKRYNADALRVVAGMDFAGSTLSNYAEPIFSLWGDVDWHWTSNSYFSQQERSL